ncbi:MAG: hypothetical protein WDA06_06430, partial [Phenylobacterium sp.]
GAIGTFISGWLADRIRGRYPNAIAWLPAVGFMVAGPLNVFGYMSGSLPVAVALLAVAQLGGSLYLGSMYAIAQGVVHPRMRATAVAVLLFVVNLIGYAGGPPAIGALSDLIANRELLAAGLSLDACRAAVSAGGVADPACTGASEVGLRWAIILGYSGLLLAAAFFLMSWRTVRRDWHEG